MTVERAAAARIFFETFYDNKWSERPTPRSLRRQKVEQEILSNTDCSTNYGSELRENWAKQESAHLRATRVMKSRRMAPAGSQSIADRFIVLKVLGKGSFGVVRLVRERSDAKPSMQPLLS